ncbi:MAG: hypothetical protein AB1938_09920 [Myxococcota bacterium]
MPIKSIPGSQIQSAYVDPSRKYAGRNLKNLEDVGALTGLKQAVAERIDGIIANQPKDGVLDVFEMERQETPPFLDTLFNTRARPEQRAFRSIWPLLEIPDVARAPKTRLPHLLVKATTVSAPGLDAAKAFALSQLSPGVRLAAERVQLVINADANPATISLQDVEQAIASPRRFTPQDVAQFHELRRELASLYAPARNSASVEVPAPGTQRIALPSSGQVRFDVKVTTSYEEVRRRDHQGNTFTRSFKGTRSSQLEVQVPPGHQAILFNADEGKELPGVLSGGKHELALAAGNYRVELWTGGRRVESSEVYVPKLVNEEVELAPQVGFTFIAGGQPLVRNCRTLKEEPVVRPGYPTEKHYEATYTLDTAADPSAIPDPFPPVLPSLPAGRYQLDVPKQGRCELEVFREGVVTFKAPRWAEPQRLFDEDGSGRFVYDKRAALSAGFYQQASVAVAFDATTSTLTVSEAVRFGPNGYHFEERLQATVTAGQRVG